MKKLQRVRFKKNSQRVSLGNKTMYNLSNFQLKIQFLSYFGIKLLQHVAFRIEFFSFCQILN